MKLLLPLGLLLAAFAVPAQAAEPTPVEGCVDLSAAHTGMRYGPKTLLVKDGAAHYRLGFAKSCDALALASAVTIAAEGQDNRLCPTGTRVSNKQGRCDVRSVEAIDPDTYARYARRR